MASARPTIISPRWPRFRIISFRIHDSLDRTWKLSFHQRANNIERQRELGGQADCGIFRRLEPSVDRTQKPVVSAIREVCAGHGRLSNYYSLPSHAPSARGSRRETSFSTLSRSRDETLVIEYRAGVSAPDFSTEHRRISLGFVLRLQIRRSKYRTGYY